MVGSFPLLEHGRLAILGDQPPKAFGLTQAAGDVGGFVFVTGHPGNDPLQVIYEPMNGLVKPDGGFAAHPLHLHSVASTSAAASFVRTGQSTR